MDLKTNSTFYQGDCLVEMDKIADRSVDMILCDLPYGTTACKWDSVIPFEPLWKQYERIIKDNGAIVLTASQPFTSVLINSNLKFFRYEWIWEKDNGTNFPSVNFQPFRVHENVLVFGSFATTFRSNGKYNYNPQFGNGKPYACVSGKQKHDTIRSGSSASNGEWETNNDGRRYPRSVLKINRDKDKLHPTQKPVSLMEYLIKTYTNEGDTVLDNCMGSGTTGVACKNTGRHFIGIEKDEKYFEIAVNRIAASEARFKEFAAQTRLF
jgi:site-specific DNA-methyltransferase (adenine-specific)